MKKIAMMFAALLAVGCAQNPGLPTLSNVRSSSFSTLSDGTGKARRLDFDYTKAARLTAMRKQGHYTTKALTSSKVDLRSKCSPVGDQGQLGACTAWAIGHGLREAMEIKNGEKYTELSPLYFYYKERERQGSLNEDSGSTITEGMSTLKEVGICPETDWPYDVAKFNVAPPSRAESDAATYKVSDVESVSDLDQIKSELSDGNTVAFGFQVHQSFMGKTVAKTGMMPVPTANDKVVGGHAVLAVGYDDSKKVLIVRNSWGPSWGDKGYFYMPYSVVESEATDFWAAR